MEEYHYYFYNRRTAFVFVFFFFARFGGTVLARRGSKEQGQGRVAARSFPGALGRVQSDTPVTDPGTESQVGPGRSMTLTLDLGVPQAGYAEQKLVAPLVWLTPVPLTWDSHSSNTERMEVGIRVTLLPRGHN